MSDSVEDIEKVISEQQVHTNPLLASRKGLRT